MCHDPINVRGRHQVIPIYTAVVDSPRIEDRFWALLTPCKNRENLGVSATEGGAAQNLEAVVDMGQVVLHLESRQVLQFRVVVPPGPSTEHLDAVKLVEYAQPSKIAPSRQGHGLLVMHSELLGRDPDSHSVHELVPGLLAFRAWLPSEGTVKACVLAELVVDIQSGKR